MPNRDAPREMAPSEDISMSIFSRKATSHANATAEVEGEISELASRNIVELRRQLVNDGNLVADVSLLLRRASASSVREIDALIRELQALRDRLHHDGERMAREIIDYASLSLAAMQSTRIIAQNLTHHSKLALTHVDGRE
jgi:hypothetical protein